MDLAYAGTARFGSLVLDRLLASPEFTALHRVVVCVTRPDRPRGHHGTPQPSPLKETALAAGLPVLQPERLDEAFVTELSTRGAAVLVVCAYGRIIPAAVLDSFETLVVHPSLLPRWRGAAPVQRALMAGETELGVATLRMAPGVDEGPIGDLRLVHVPREADAGEAFEALAQPAAEGLLAVLDGLATGRVEWREQEGEPSYAAKIEDADRRIDWRRPAPEIADQVRALSPQIGAVTELGGRRVLVWQARPVDEPLSVGGGAGPVVAAGDRLLVATGEGWLEILDLQQVAGETPPPAARARVAPAREAAYAVLLRAEREPGRLDLALGARPELAGLAPRDRSLAFELVAGTLRRRNSLDAVLGAFTGGRRLSRVDVAVRAALRLGAFQLLYLDRVPAHAVVNDSVELAKRRSRRAGGFVNAVLRRVAAEGREQLEQIGAGTSTAAVALRTSHPEWLARLWRDELGDETALALLEADNVPLPRCVRVNRHLCTPAEAIAALAVGRITASPVDGFPLALVIDGPPLEPSAAFRDGLVTPQSLGSQLAAHVALEGLTGSAAEAQAPGGAEVGEIADLCAAPGAKTSQLADVWPAARVVAVEADEARAAGLRANLARQRLESVRVVVADVLELGPEFDGRFAAVLLDPPCTGLGTLTSRPDLRWRQRPGDVGRLADLQRRLLERAAGLVEPGGALTYSVCTITEAETLGVVEPFLAGGGWALDDLSAAYPRFAHPKRGGLLLTLPPRDRTSGFFIARLRREVVAIGGVHGSPTQSGTRGRSRREHRKEQGGRGENR